MANDFETSIRRIDELERKIRQLMEKETNEKTEQVESSVDKMANDFETATRSKRDELERFLNQIVERKIIEKLADFKKSEQFGISYKMANDFETTTRSKRDELDINQIVEKKISEKLADFKKREQCDTESISSKDEHTNNKFINAIRAFGEMTSLHGFGHILQKKKNFNKGRWKNKAYLVVLLACMVQTIIYIHQIIKDFRNNPQTTEIKIEKRDRMVHPLVQMATNDNFMINESLMGWPRWYCLFGDKSCKDEDIVNTVFLHGLVFNYNKNVILYSENKNGDTWNTRLGLEMQIDLDVTTQKLLTGDEGQLQVEINVNPGSTYNQRFDKPALVFLPGTVNKVFLKKVQNIFTEPEPGKCRDVDDELNKQLNRWADHRGYSVVDCILTCIDKAFNIKHLNCTFSGLPGFNLCNLSVIKGGLNDKLKYDKQAVDKDCRQNVCLPECSETYFETQVETSPLTRYYRNRLEKTFNINNMSSEYFQKYVTNNFVILEVKMRDLNVKKTITSPKYNFVDVLSNIGGVLGVFTGFSILTVTEIAELLLDLFCTLVFKLTR